MLTLYIYDTYTCIMPHYTCISLLLAFYLSQSPVKFLPCDTIMVQAQKKSLGIGITYSQDSPQLCPALACSHATADT